MFPFRARAPEAHFPAPPLSVLQQTLVAHSPPRPGEIFLHHQRGNTRGTFNPLLTPLTTLLDPNTSQSCLLFPPMCPFLLLEKHPIACLLFFLLYFHFRLLVLFIRYLLPLSLSFTPLFHSFPF